MGERKRRDDYGDVDGVANGDDGDGIALGLIETRKILLC